MHLSNEIKIYILSYKSTLIRIGFELSTNYILDPANKDYELVLRILPIGFMH